MIFHRYALLAFLLLLPAMAQARSGCPDAGSLSGTLSGPGIFPLADGRWIDRSGRIVPAPNETATAAGASACAPVAARDEATQKYGFKTAAGTWAIKPVFKDVSPFRSGYAAVTLDVAAKQKALDATMSYQPCRYASPSGDFLAGQFAVCEDFTGTLAAVETEAGGVGFIDRTGALALANATPADWSAAATMTRPGMTEGLLAVRDLETEKVGYVNSAGRWVIKPRFANGHEFHEGLAAVTQTENGPVGFIDKRGKLVVPFRFATNFFNPPSFSEGLAAVGKDEAWPRTNLDPPGHLGFIDKTGRWVIKPRFHSGQNFAHGLARVYVNDREIYIDRAGTMIWPRRK